MTRDIQICSKSEFSGWLKNYGPQADEDLDGVDIQDIDYVVFAYLAGDLMTVEAKERNGYIRKPQRDTQNIIRQLLMLGATNSTVETIRGTRPIKYHGHHLIQFQKTTPDNGWVKLDGKIVTRDQLVKFLNFGREIKENHAPQT